MEEVFQTDRFAKWLRKLKDNLAKVAKYAGLKD